MIAAGFSYVAGYGIRLMPVIQARSQLREVYDRDVTDEIVANCGVELVFTPKDITVAKEISERLGNYTFAAKSRSRRIWESFEGSVSTSDQRRPLMLPQELLLMSQDDVIVLRAGIPPVEARKIRYYRDKWMRQASDVAPPEVACRPLDLSISHRSLDIIEASSAEEMTDDEAAGGIDFARLLGVPVHLLPADGDPAKASDFFEAFGLAGDLTGLAVPDAPGFSAIMAKETDNGERTRVAWDG